jgi:hypothetical protein
MVATFFKKIRIFVWTPGAPILLETSGYPLAAVGLLIKGAGG